ncbi:MAG: hypothetical protein K2Q20_03385, partial [Phycisphaerales bacterium]|nr:hypothetical protein [Phycisphaerales bacterium]
MNPRSLTSRAACAVIAAGACCGLAQAQQIFLSQDFNSATLSSTSAGASGDPTVAQACSANEPRFTHNLAPIGWTNDFCGVPTYACANPSICTTLLPDTNCSGFPAVTTDKTRPGKFEWEGWSVANRSWWSQVAGSQRRQEFTLSSGNCLVADADDFEGDGTAEADPFPYGTYNAFATTRSISLAGANLATLSLAFASSWRPEGFDDGPSVNGQQTNNQTATIEAIYTVGGVDQAPVQIFKYDSDTASPTYKADATNEAVTVNNLQAPAGATAVKFRIGLSNARNDWWWAVDNFALSSTASATPLWTENFDSGLTLQNPVDCLPSGCAVAYCGLNVLTRNFPNGFTFANNASVTGGASDWRGWVLVEPAYHACLQGSGSEQFTLGTGLIAVANGDRFADLPNGGPLDTSLSTPSFNISTRTQDNLLLSFNSSWLPDGSQTAEIFADYVTPTGTQSVRVLSWSSQSDNADFKPDALNENVFVPLAIPAGTTSMSLRFKYVGGNNWWWAIDNIRVFQGQATVPYAAVSPSRTNMALSLDVPYTLCSTPWSVTPPAGWAANFVRCGSCTANPYCGVPEFEGWSFVDKDWWVQIQGNQRRLEFTKGTGRIAVADNDTWDDIPNGQSQFNAFVSTPAIPLPGTITDIALNFDSSWRPEAFDDGSSCDPNPAPVDVLSITALDANTATVTTAAAHNLVTGNYVDFTVPAGAATFQNANNTVATAPGRVRVTVTSPTTFTFP